MPNTLRLKRSATALKVPLTTDLLLGEMAFNTNDGRLFAKKNSGSDAIVEFLSTDSAFKTNVRAATTASITLSGTQTIDGIACVAGDRVLVKDQGTTSQNGIYIVAAGAWTRAPDADAAAELAGAVVMAASGTANGGKLFRTSFVATQTLGTDAVTFSEVGAGGGGGGTWGSITGTLSSQTDLQAALNLKANLTDIHGQQTIWVAAESMTPRNTNGAAWGSFQTTTNLINVRTLDFDATTQEFAQFGIQMPRGWDEGTLIFQFIWYHPATTVNFGVVWQVQAVAFANDDALDGLAFPTAVTIADTGGTTNDLYISDETAAVTVAGTPTPEEFVQFQIARAPANASDTMAVDARLIGVKIHYTINAAKDD
jgi:hypothetical protein